MRSHSRGALASRTGSGEVAMADWQIEEAQEFSRKTKRESERLEKLVTPKDPQLGEKLRRLGEQAGETDKYVETRSDPKQG
jgi:hypothetical protein